VCRSVENINADKKLLAAGQIAAVGLLFMARVPISLLFNLIMAVESRSNGADLMIPFRLSVLLKSPSIIEAAVHKRKT
jgi:hypothetical protein